MPSHLGLVLVITVVDQAEVTSAAKYLAVLMAVVGAWGTDTAELAVANGVAGTGRELADALGERGEAVRGSAGEGGREEGEDWEETEGMHL